MPFFLRPALTVTLLALGSACTSTTTEAIGGSGPDVLIDDVNADATTVGGEDSDVGVDPAELCGDLEAGDDLWVPQAGDFALRDRQTGSLWNVRGQAFDGPCAGAQLEQVPAFTVFWFSWSISRHGGSIWNQETPNEAGAISADASADCAVPCSEIRSGGPPPDGIPALDHLGRWDRPRAQQMVAPDNSEADYLGDFDMVLGVARDGQARAYPHALLNWHENHIDAMGGVEYNVTYCPLTGSGILIPADQGDDEPFYFFVSGRLYNDNLTMFERDAEDPTFWNQMLLQGIGGLRVGERLEHWPIVETTWSRWRQMYPDTLVASGDTGYRQSLEPNPYTSRQREDANPLFPVSPQWDLRYPTKSRVLAVDYDVEGGGAGRIASRAYPFTELDSFGDRVVVNDTIEDGPSIVVVYEAEHRMAIPFDRAFNGTTLTFDGTVAP